MQQLPSGECRHGVASLRGNLTEWLEDEPARSEPGMWKDKRRRLDYLVANEDEIEVECAGRPREGSTPFACLLNDAKAFQDGVGFRIRQADSHGVQEVRLGRDVNGFSLDKG